MAYFEPLIGSSFDSLAGQRLNWANFSQRQDEANLGRAQAAEQSRNAYLERLAQMQAQDAARADRSQLDSTQLQLEANRQNLIDTEARRRFDIGTGLTKEQQAIEAKRYDFQKAQQDQVKQQALDSAENYAKFKADDVAQVGDAVDKAKDRYETAMAAREKAVSEAGKGLPADKVRYQGGSNEFVWADKSGLSPKPEVAAAIQSANEKLAAASSEFKAASADYKTHLDNWNELLKEANAVGLTVGKKNGKHGLLRIADGSFFGSAAKASEADTSQDDEETGVSPVSTPAAAPAASGMRRVVRGLDGKLMFAPDATASSGSGFFSRMRWY